MCCSSGGTPDTWTKTQYMQAGASSVIQPAGYEGSIAINGTSLTVCEVSSEWFEVSLIPTTLTGTVLGGLEPGEPVNIEVDVIAKYLESLVNKEKSC